MKMAFWVKRQYLVWKIYQYLRLFTMARESSAGGFPTIDHLKERDEWKKNKYNGNDLTKTLGVGSGKHQSLLSMRPP